MNHRQPDIASLIDELPLTPREKQIVALILRDLPDKHIADELGLTERTVNFYIGNIRQKLNVPTRLGIALTAVGYCKNTV